MTIKTFPLQFTEDKLKAIQTRAAGEGKSIKQFMLDAIDHEMNQEVKGLAEDTHR